MIHLGAVFNDLHLQQGPVGSEGRAKTRKSDSIEKRTKTLLVLIFLWDFLKIRKIQNKTSHILISA